MIVERLPKTPRRNPLDHSEGFTLIELMIVILILAILVGIAVAVMSLAKTRAADAVAKANHRIGEGANTTTFLGLGLASYSNAPYPTTWYRYLSTVETKITWVTLTATSGSNVMSIGSGYKKNVVVTRTGTGRYFTFLYGKIGIYQGYVGSDNKWYPATTTTTPTYRYITVIVLNQSNNRGFFSVYDLGTLTRSGSFAWNSSNGQATDFQAQ
ncbi:MAG TPA: prepilin-type N-terminal cleavage/methylation domain-containing protein [Candidatus Anoxymicrobiaceae bacterium]